MAAGELLDQQIPRSIGVLIFVNHHEPESLRILLADRGHALEEVDCLEQQIVEVECTGILEGTQVSREEARHFTIAGIPTLLEHFGTFHPIFGVADTAQDGARLIGVVVEAVLLDQLLDHRLLIARIVDDEVARQADMGRLATQQPGA